MSTLRLATANAASGRDDRRGTTDVRPWAAAAAGLDVDVLAVQEVDHLLPRSGGDDQTALVAAACAGDGPAWQSRFAAAVTGTPGDRSTFAAAASTQAGVASYGVALLSRHPVQRWDELRMAPSRLSLPVPLPPGAGRRVLWAPDEQRVALAAVLDVPGSGAVTVVCTHLSFSPMRAAAQLREVVAWASDLPRPLVLVGDLNLPGGWPARVTGWRPLVQERTFPAERPAAQLDHVLLDDPARRVEVAGAGSHRLATSDHRALRVELAVVGSSHDHAG